MGLTRKQGWEARLAESIESARPKRYVLGQHDCLRVALGAVEALTGIDMWSRFAGKYASRREALRLIADRARWDEFYGDALEPERVREAREKCGSIFEVVFSLLFESLPEDMRLARKGDIVKYVDREEHLGVCLGAHVAVLKDDGLAFIPRSKCSLCWRIG